MRKFFKILVFIMELAIVIGLIVGLIYLAKWIGKHDFLTVGEVFNGA